MSIYSISKFILIFVVYSLCSILSCSGTETTNECTPYTIYMPDGVTPAGGTYVNVIPNDMPGISGDTLIADCNGNFTFSDKLNPGKWSVLFTYPGNDTLAAWQELVINSSGVISFHNVTLESAGTISGIVQLHPYDKEFLHSVVVGLLGTSRAVNADSTGKFTLFQVPKGLYTIHCSVPAKLENYGELNVPFVRPNGNDTILLDTLRLPYIGFPFAEGLSATIDSLSGVVHLKWNPSGNDYNAMVIRTRRGADLTFDTLAVTDKNYFCDTLYSITASGSRFSLSDTLPISLVYRIRLCRKNLDCGDFWESVTVICQSPLLFQTRVTVTVNNKPVGVQSQMLSNNEPFLTDIEFKNDRIPVRTLFLRDVERDSILDIFIFNPPVRSGKKSTTLHWMSTGEHTVQIVSLDSNDNKINTIDDTFILKTFDSLPAVNNISWQYDSITGIVTLQWSKNKEPEFLKYIVYRNLIGDTVSSECIYSSKDTCCSDTLFGRLSGKQFDINLNTPINAEYTIVCLNTNNDTGKTAGTGSIRFLPPLRISSILSFEGLNSLPDLWEYSAYDYSLNSSYALSNDGHNSSRSLHLTTTDSINDIRCELRLSGLDSGAVYRISCWIKSSDVVVEVPPNTGAALWIDEDHASTSPVIIGTNDWTRCICIYTANSSSCKIWTRLGCYGNRMLGEVWFDDITIEQLN